jgi:hypothetical protein
MPETLEYAARPQIKRGWAFRCAIDAYLCVIPALLIAIGGLLVDVVHRDWIDASLFNTLIEVAVLFSLIGMVLALAAMIGRSLVLGVCAGILNFAVFAMMPSFIYGVWYVHVLPWWS